MPDTKSRRYEERAGDIARASAIVAGIDLPIRQRVRLEVCAFFASDLEPLTLDRDPDPSISLVGDRSDCAGDDDRDIGYYADVPDWDNIGKAIGDGLKIGRVIVDDRRIVVGRVEKRKARVARVEVQVILLRR